MRHFSSLAESTTKFHSLQDALAAIDSWHSPQSIATYASVIRLCTNSPSLSAAQRIRGHLAAHNADQNTFLGNLLVELYGKCGSLDECRQAFARIASPNTYSWNIIMAAYITNSNLPEAWGIFSQMPDKDVVSWNAIITAHAQMRQCFSARDIFYKMPHWDVWTWNVMIRVFFQIGFPERAKHLFDKMPQRTLVTWNTLVGEYARNRHLRDAVQMFQRIPMRDMVLWNEVAMAFLDENMPYRAIDLLEAIPGRDTVSWNTQTKAFSQAGDLDRAKRSFDSTPKPDLASFTTMVVAYSQQGDLARAREVFDRMPGRDTVAWTAMVSGYAQNGHIAPAEKLFQEMPEKNLVSWNAMVAAYGQNCGGKMAVHLFRLMDLEGVQADSVSFVSALDGCSSETSLPEGRILHAAAMEQGLDRHTMVANSLVAMYASCGCIGEARRLFDGIQAKTVVSWSTMVAAYAQNSETRRAFEVFRMMLLDGTMPNEVTATIVLSLCSQSGKVGDARNSFLLVTGEFGIQPRMDHFLCIVDVVARSGRLELAEEVIKDMPFEADPSTWRTLLSACRNQEDSELGVHIAEQAIDPEMQESAAYILLSNSLH